jgi:hypothetical protein
MQRSAAWFAVLLLVACGGSMAPPPPPGSDPVEVAAARDIPCNTGVRIVAKMGGRGSYELDTVEGCGQRLTYLGSYDRSSVLLVSRIPIAP